MERSERLGLEDLLGRPGQPVLRAYKVFQGLLVSVGQPAKPGQPVPQGHRAQLELIQLFQAQPVQRGQPDPRGQRGLIQLFQAHKVKLALKVQPVQILQFPVHKVQRAHKVQPEFLEAH